MEDLEVDKGEENVVSVLNHQDMDALSTMEVTVHSLYTKQRPDRSPELHLVASQGVFVQQGILRRHLVE